MTDSHIGSTQTQRNILEYLKSLRLLQGDLDVEVKSATRTGVLQVRKGQVIAAECGNLRGNGAFLTLAALGVGEVHGTKSERPVEKNVFVNVTQVERFFAKIPVLSLGDSHCNEAEILQDAIQLFFQFRRKEAGAKLVEVLRSNRFYYPAWLWHSRLMTREDYIKKALVEARKWGNADPSIIREVQKIEPQLTGATNKVKRCIFCWSLVRAGEDRCLNCHGLQRISKIENGVESTTGELQQTLSLYEEEFLKNPKNLRIAYCLCLGFCSVGKIDRAREFINKALIISPREPLFIRASAILQPEQNSVRQHFLPNETAQQERAQLREPVVRLESPGEGQKNADKTILVVEDSKTARKVISLVLGRKGYKIIEATTGTEALLAIAGVIPDLVLLDVMLPDMTGYDVLSTIRKDSQLTEVPVVMLTGKSGAADRQRGIVSGSNEYLTKPFDPGKLLRIIGKYLESPVNPANTPQSNLAEKTEPPPSPVQSETVVKPAAIEVAVAHPTAVQPTAVVKNDKGMERSVLVVEDSPTSRKVISMVLSRKGYVVNEAATGMEALRMVEDQLPHLILLDAMLPDMTGYDILAQLKQDPRLMEIPVVMLTAKDSPMDREKGMRAGSAAYLTKPFNPDKLLSVIGDYI